MSASSRSLSARPSSEHDKALTLLATDLASAYGRFVEEYPNPDAVTIDDFDFFFREAQLEHMHYCGGTSFSCPYHPRIAHALLELSAAYLYLPSAVMQRHVRVFGLMLCYFFFATQPQRGEDSCLPPAIIPIDLHVLEGLIDLLEQESADLAVGREMSSSAPSASPPQAERLTTAERTAVLSLHEHRAWHVQPFAAVRPSLSALMQAHEVVNVPLLRRRTTAASAWRGPTDSGSTAYEGAGGVSLLPACGPLLSDGAFRQQWEDYKKLKDGMGL